MKQPARLHHRDVEGLAVVGDDEVRVLEELRDRGEQRALAGVAGEEELAHLECAEVEVSATDEEGDRAGAAAQAGGFEIDEHRAPWRQLRQSRIEHAQRIEVVHRALADLDPTVPAIRFVAAVDHHALAELRSDAATTEGAGDVVGIERCRTAIPVVRLVGKLPPGGATTDDGAEL